MSINIWGRTKSYHLVGRGGDPGGSPQSKASCRQELRWCQELPERCSASAQQSGTSARVSHRALWVPSQWWRCCVSPSPRLEQDIKKLKADLQASRQVEQELRSQISSLSSTERGIRSEMGQLRQENELLQNKYVYLWAFGHEPRSLTSLLFPGIGAQDCWWQRDLAGGFLIKCLFYLGPDIQHVIKSVKSYFIVTKQFVNITILSSLI